MFKNEICIIYKNNNINKTLDYLFILRYLLLVIFIVLYQFTKKSISIVFIHFSLLMACTYWILHLAIIALFPFWFTWGITSDLLILCSIIHILALSWTTNYVVVMHTLALRHHSTESSSVGEHFVTIGSSKILAADHILVFLASCKMLVLSSSVILLAFNIYRRLRSNSVFGRSWTWFLRVGSTLFSHALTADRVIILTIRNTVAHQIVMLLYETKWIRWGSVVVHTIVFGKTLSVWTCWSFLSSSRSQTLSTIALIWTDAIGSSLVGFLRTVSNTARNVLSTSHHLSRWLHIWSMILIHFVFESCGSDWTSRFKYAQLLLI